MADLGLPNIEQEVFGSVEPTPHTDVVPGQTTDAQMYKYKYDHGQLSQNDMETAIQQGHLKVPTFDHTSNEGQQQYNEWIQGNPYNAAIYKANQDWITRQKVDATSYKTPSGQISAYNNYKINRVLQAAPTLAKRPDVVYALINNQTPFDPQDIAAIIHAQTLLSSDKAKDWFDVLNEQNQGTNIFKLGADFTAGLGGAAAQGISDIFSPITSAESAVKNKIAQGVGSVAGPSVGAATAGAIETVLPSPKVIADQVQQLAQTPSQIYRYIAAVQHKHGTVAAFLAAAPLIAVGGAAAIATKGAGEGAAVGETARLLGAEGETAAASGEVAAGTEGLTEQDLIRKAIQDTWTRRFATVTDAIAAVPRTGFRIGNAVLNSPSLLGAEATAQVSGRIIYPNEWNDAADGTAWAKKYPMLAPTFGNYVSENVGLGKNSVLSGATDFLYSFAVPDPMGASGRIVGQAKSAEGLSGVFGGKVDDKWYGKLYNSTGFPIWGGTAFDKAPNAYNQYPSVRNAVNFIAKSDATDIMALDPRLSEVANDLANLKVYNGDTLDMNATVDNVLKFFSQLDGAQQYALDMSRMPMSTKALITARTKLADGKLNPDHIFTPLPSHLEDGHFNNVDFSPGDRKVLPAMRNMLRSLGFKDEVVHHFINDLAASTDINHWTTAYRNLMLDRMSADLADTVVKLPKGDISVAKVVVNPIQERMTAAIDAMIGAPGPNQSRVYGYGSTNLLSTAKSETEGGLNQPLSTIADETEKSTAAAIFPSQLGRLRFINYNTYKDAMHQLVTALVKDENVLNVSRVKEQISAIEAKAAERPLTDAEKTKLQALHRAGMLIEDPRNLTYEALTNAASYRSGRMMYTIDKWVNDKWFKPLALATGGWAFRVSLSEDILNILRLGPINWTAAQFAKAGVRHERAYLDVGREFSRPVSLRIMARAHAILHGMPLIGGRLFASNEEAGHFTAAVSGILRAIDYSAVKGLNKQEILDAAITSMYLNGGHIVVPALNSNHGTGLYDTSVNSYKDDNAIHAWENLPPSTTDPAFQRKVHSGRWGEISATEGATASQFPGAHYNYAKMLQHDIVAKPIAEAMYHAYIANLSKGKVAAMAAAEEVGRTTALEAFAALPEDVRSQMYRQKHELWDSAFRTGLGPKADHAEAAMQVIKGMVVAPNQSVHEDLFHDLAMGRLPSTPVEHYNRYLKDKDLGLFNSVPGEISVASTLQRVKFSPQAIGGYMHDKFLGPIVNSLSREPTFIVEFAKERKAIQSAVGKTLTQDQADTIALTRATQKMVKFVHNPQDKLKIENVLRIVAPFYFAQNQAYRRVGRLLAENPGAFEQYVKLLLGAQNQILQMQQKNSIPVVNIPWSSGFTGALTGAIGAANLPLLGHFGPVPIPLGGSLDSLNTVDPLAPINNTGDPSKPPALVDMLFPKFGPVMTVGGRIAAEVALRNGNPAVADFLGTYIVGPQGMSAPMWSLFLPNSLAQHVIEGGFGFASGTGTFDPKLGAVQGGGNFLDSAVGSSSAFVSTEYDAWERVIGQEWSKSLNTASKIQPPPDWPETRSNYTLMTAIADFTRRLNPYNQTNNEYQKVLDQVHGASAVLFGIKSALSYASPVSISLQKPDMIVSNEFQSLINAHGGDVIAASNQLVKENPYAMPDLIFGSHSTQGVSFPETYSATKWLENNMALYDKYKAAVRYLMPASVSAPGLPYDSLGRQMQITMGLRRQDVPAELTNEFLITMGNYAFYNILQPYVAKQVSNGQMSASQAYTVVKNFVGGPGGYGMNYNPVWMNNYNEKPGRDTRQALLNSVQEMVRTLPASKYPVLVPVKDIIDNGLPALRQMVQNHSPNATERGIIWNKKLDEIAKQYPAAVPIIDTLFRPMAPIISTTGNGQ